MDYSVVVEALYERHRSVRDAGFSGDAYKPGLDAMLSYAEFLGHPERQFRTVHVAGTNGKGSVCSMLAAALAARGLRVGLYTSPHLVDFRERMKIIAGAAATMISQEDVCRFMERYDREGLTFFEVTTGMAFWWFAKERVDVAVIETGLGGRLDSTNIITPELSVITSIGLDHCDLLGSTRAGIAAEKAGIFKPGVPALVWGRDPETQPVFERIAAQAGAPLFFAGDFPAALAFAMQSEPLDLDLSGPCQDLNLRTVLAALSLLQGPTAQAEFAAIASAARITGLRGRWEQLLADPLTICDIGHNPPAIAANFARLYQLRSAQNDKTRRPQADAGDSCVAAQGGPPPCPLGVQGDNSLPRRPLLVVYGAMKDKDVDEIKQYLPNDAEYYLVQPRTARAMPLDELALKLKSFNCTVAGTVEQGVQQALERGKHRPGAIVYIGGSTYVVSEAIITLEKK
jgi:dihydrofolate synthase/folylpolyglutamate synthase